MEDALILPRQWERILKGPLCRKALGVVGLTHSRIPDSLGGTEMHGWCHLLPQHYPGAVLCGQGGIASLAIGSPSPMDCLSLLTSYCTD